MLENKVSFFEFIVSTVINNALAALTVGPQVFLSSIKVIANHTRCGVEDYLRGTIVLFQADNGRVWKILLEIKDVTEICTAPLID